MVGTVAALFDHLRYHILGIILLYQLPYLALQPISHY